MLATQIPLLFVFCFNIFSLLQLSGDGCKPPLISKDKTALIYKRKCPFKKNNNNFLRSVFTLRQHNARFERCGNILLSGASEVRRRVSESQICCRKKGALARARAHTRAHTQTRRLHVRRKPIVRRGDRWRGQAVSEEVKQKQAEDCFPPSPAPPPSGDSAGQCFLRQVTTFQLGESTLFFHFFFSVAQLGTTSCKSAVQTVERRYETAAGFFCFPPGDLKMYTLTK